MQTSGSPSPSLNTLSLLFSALAFFLETSRWTLRCVVVVVASYANSLLFLICIIMRGCPSCFGGIWSCAVSTIVFVTRFIASALRYHRVPSLLFAVTRLDFFLSLSLSAPFIWCEYIVVLFCPVMYHLLPFIPCLWEAAIALYLMCIAFWWTPCGY